MGKLDFHSFNLISKNRMNPRVIKSIFASTSDSKILEKLKNHLTAQVSKGDKTAITLLAKLAEDKTLSESKRLVALDGLKSLILSKILLGKEADKVALGVYLRGVKSDTSGNIRIVFADGLRALAQKGEKETHIGLNFLAQKGIISEKFVAADGLKYLAKEGMIEALPGLIACALSENLQVVKKAEEGIAMLGEKGRTETTVWINNILKKAIPVEQDNLMRALGKLAKLGDKRAYIGLNESLVSMEQRKRWLALKELTQLAREGNIDEAFYGVIRSVNDTDEGNRRLALSCLSDLAQSKPKLVFMPLTKGLNDRVIVNKQIARDALKEIVKANPEYAKKIKELRITL